MGRRKIAIDDFVLDVRSGLSEIGLMEKFQLTSDQLETILQQLVEAGKLDLADLEITHPQQEVTIALASTCPVCGALKLADSSTCSECGDDGLGTGPRTSQPVTEPQGALATGHVLSLVEEAVDRLVDTWTLDSGEMPALKDEPEAGEPQRQPNVPPEPLPEEFTLSSESLPSEPVPPESPSNAAPPSSSSVPLPRSALPDESLELYMEVQDSIEEVLADPIKAEPITAEPVGEGFESEPAEDRVLRKSRLGVILAAALGIAAVVAGVGLYTEMIPSPLALWSSEPPAPPAKSVSRPVPQAPGKKVPPKKRESTPGVLSEPSASPTQTTAPAVETPARPSAATPPAASVPTAAGVPPIQPPLAAPSAPSPQPAEAPATAAIVAAAPPSLSPSVPPEPPAVETHPVLPSPAATAEVHSGPTEFQPQPSRLRSETDFSAPAGGLPYAPTPEMPAAVPESSGEESREPPAAVTKPEPLRPEALVSEPATSPILRAAAGPHPPAPTPPKRMESDPPVAVGEDPEQLVSAVREGNSARVKLILQRGVSPDSRDRAGATALMLAAGQGDEYLAEVLLKAGADPRLSDDKGATSILYALKAKRPGVLRLLIALDAEAGAGPLLAAAKEGRSEQIRLLLANGADVDARNAEGNTALMAAASAAQVEVVRLLLESGANVNAKNENGITALSLAYTSPAESTVPLRFRRDVVRLLKEHSRRQRGGVLAGH